MASDATLNANITANDNASSVIRNFDNNLKSVGRTSEDVKAKLRELYNESLVLRRAGEALTFGLTVPLVALGTAAINTATRFESLTQALKINAGSAEAANKQFKELRELAKLPGIGFEEAIQGAVRLESVGLSAQKAAGYMKEFSNAIALAGGQKEDLYEVMVNVQQMMSAGVVSQRELRETSRRMPQIFSLLKEQYGDDPAKKIKELGLSVEQVMDRLVERMQKMPRAPMDTARNAFDNFKDSVNQAAAAIGQTALPAITQFLKIINPGLELMGNLFAKLPVPIQALVGGLGLVAAAAGPVIHLIGQIQLVSLAYQRFMYDRSGDEAKQKAEQDRINNSIRLENALLTHRTAVNNLEVAEYRAKELQKTAIEKEQIAQRMAQQGGGPGVDRLQRRVGSISGSIEVASRGIETIGLREKQQELTLEQALFKEEKAKETLITAEAAKEQSKIVEAQRRLDFAKRDADNKAATLKRTQEDKAIATSRKVELEAELKLKEKELADEIAMTKRAEVEMNEARSAQRAVDEANNRVVLQRQRVAQTTANVERLQANQVAGAEEVVVASTVNTAKTEDAVLKFKQTLADEAAMNKNFELDRLAQEGKITKEELQIKRLAIDEELALRRASLNSTTAAGVASAAAVATANVQAATTSATAWQKVKGAVSGWLGGGIGGFGAILGGQMALGMLPDGGVSGQIKGAGSNALNYLMLASLAGPKIGPMMTNPYVLAAMAAPVVSEWFVEGHERNQQGLDPKRTPGDWWRNLDPRRLWPGVAAKQDEEWAQKQADEAKNEVQARIAREGTPASRAKAAAAAKQVQDVFDEEEKRRIQDSRYRTSLSIAESTISGDEDTRAQQEYKAYAPIIKERMEYLKKEGDRLYKDAKTDAKAAQEVNKTIGEFFEEKTKLQKLQQDAENEQKENIKKSKEKQDKINQTQREAMAAQAEAMVARFADDQQDQARAAVEIPLLQKRIKEIKDRMKALLPTIKTNKDDAQEYNDLQKEGYEKEREAYDLLGRGQKEREQNNKKIVDQQRRDTDSYFDALREQAKARVNSAKDDVKKQAEAEVLIPVLKNEQEFLFNKAQRLKAGTEEYNKVANDYWKLEGEISNIQIDAIKEREENQKKAEREAKKTAEDQHNLLIQRTKTQEEAIKANPFLNPRERERGLVKVLMERYKDMMQAVSGETELEAERRRTEAQQTRREIFEAMGMNRRGMRTLGGGPLGGAFNRRDMMSVYNQLGYIDSHTEQSNNESDNDKQFTGTIDPISNQEKSFLSKRD